MKRSPRNNHSYQAKRIQKIINSQVNVLTDLVETALNKGKLMKDGETDQECVIYQDEMYRAQLAVQTDSYGKPHPVGHGKIDCVGDGDDDYMKFCYDTHSCLSSSLKFQWGRSKGEVHFEAGQLMGSAQIIEAVDRRFIMRRHLFIAKKISAFLALAACIGFENAHNGSHRTVACRNPAIVCNIESHVR